MKNILLIGGFGFIGTNILCFVDELKIEQYRVIVFDKNNNYQNKFKCVNKIYNGDFEDIESIEKIFIENKIDIILHSLSTTIPSTSQSFSDIDSNLLPSIKVLELMVKYNTEKIIFLSSGGAIYGNINSDKKHNENDITYPMSSYGIIKLTIEKYIYQYSCLHNIKSMVLRLSNPYGKYHFNKKQGIINIASRCALSSKVFSVWGDGNTKKDYIFIDDFCDILFKLIDFNDSFLLLNIGSGQILSINYILNTIKKIIPSFTWKYVEKSETDIQKIELDTTKLLSIINPFKFTIFQEGLLKTINWIKDNI